MARALLIAGLIVLVLGVLFQLFVLLVSLAIPIGLALIVVGGVWFAVNKSRGRG